MPEITKKSKVMKPKIIFAMIIISMIFSINASAQKQQTIITVIGVEEDQYEDILYHGIEVNQIVDFSNLIRVYINKASVVMVDNNPVAFDKTAETIRTILITNVVNNHGNISADNIDNASCELKLLVRKSSFTKKEDYRAFMSMVNESVWGLQKYYSNKVYNKEYPSLTQNEKDRINKLVPLKNLLAKDNTD